jgi:hypothetical protein
MPSCGRTRLFLPKNSWDEFMIKLVISSSETKFVYRDASIVAAMQRGDYGANLRADHPDTLIDRIRVVSP